MDDKDKLINEAVLILKGDKNEERLRNDLEMIASLFGVEAIQQRINDAKSLIHCE